MTTERWLPVPIEDYAKTHEISDRGRVRRILPDGTKRMLSPNRTQSGHMNVHLRAHGKRKAAGIHRLMMLAFEPHEDASSLEVCHNDGNPAHNVLSNLRWDTKSGNALDEVHGGRHYLASRTHCNNGHEFTEENTQIRTDTPRPARRCLECKRIRDRENQRRYRAAKRHNPDLDAPAPF